MRDWHKRHWLLLGLLTLLAVGMRFYRLDQLPPGLHSDEAYNGLDALSLVGEPLWAWPLFFSANNGREPLYIYLSVLPHWIWGASILSVRLVPALAGVLMTPASAWLAWELAPSLQVKSRARFALWAGLAVLGLLWSQMFSRFGVRISLFLLLETLFWAALWRAWHNPIDVKSAVPIGASGIPLPLGAILSPTRRANLFLWILAGILAGLSFYTYLPSRILPALLLPVAALILLRHRDALGRRWRGIGFFLLTAALVSAPLAVHFLQNPADFVSRTSQVSEYSQGGIPAILANIEPVLGMAFVRGDSNLLVNVPLRPVLDAVTTVPFLLGILLLLWRFYRPGPLFLLSGLVVMLLPTFLSGEAPNFGRAIGALPVFVLAIVLGVDRLTTWGEKWWPLGRRWFSLAGWIVLLAAFVLTRRAYFDKWASVPDLYIWWDQGYTDLARHMIAAGNGATDPVDRVYVSPRNADHTTMRYLLKTHPDVPPLQGFDGRVCVRVTTDQPAHYYFLADEDFRGPTLLQSYLPDSTLQVAVSNPAGDPWATLLTHPAGGVVQFPEQTPLAVPMADGIALQGYWLSQAQLTPGEALYVRLFWNVTATPSQDYTAFAHLIRMDSSGGSAQLAGADQRPGAGSCPTNQWLPREVVVDEMQFVVPADLPTTADEEYYLEIGFYTLADGRRLDIPDNAEDRILIGPLSLPKP